MPFDNSVRIGSRSIAVPAWIRSCSPRTPGPKAVTKGDLIEYYREVAPALLRYLKDRPISLQRYPGGIGRRASTRRKCPTTSPPGSTGRVSRSWRRAKSKAGDLQRRCDARLPRQPEHHHLPPLVELPTGCIIPTSLFSIWTRRVRFEAARQAAWRLRDLLTGLGLHPFVMTTGSRELHVVTRWIARPILTPCAASPETWPACSPASILTP